MTDLPKLIDLITAAAMLQPHVGTLNAGNWLADMRRKKHFYRPRVFTAPLCWKHGGRIMYPRAEMVRLIREIEIVDNESAAKKWCA
jgi:hypothetical protein